MEGFVLKLAEEEEWSREGYHGWEERKSSGGKNAAEDVTSPQRKKGSVHGDLSVKTHPDHSAARQQTDSHSTCCRETVQH